MKAWTRSWSCTRRRSLFGHNLTSDSTFFVRGPNVGLQEGDRQVAGPGQAPWACRPTGTVPTKARPLSVWARRNWTFQAGGLVGKRLGNFHVTLDGNADVAGEHDGYEFALTGAYVLSSDRWQIVPEVKATWESDKLLNHYFGVRDSEALPGRPSYMPGSALTWSGVLDVSYRISSKWYVTAVLAVDVLPDEIRRSPVVDKDTIWRVNLGVAYDADAFVDPDALDDDSLFEISVGAFFATAENQHRLSGRGRWLADF